MTDLTRANFGHTLNQYIYAQKLTEAKAAKAIGCSNKTIARLICGHSNPSDHMLKQAGVMMVIGFPGYSKLSKAERETISQTIGSVGGGVLGLGSVAAVVSSLGYAGLSAAGIASGLAALGAIVGGGMAAGLTVAAAIPIAAGFAGLGIVKGIKAVVGKYNDRKEELDPVWELPLTHR